LALTKGQMLGQLQLSIMIGHLSLTTPIEVTPIYRPTLRPDNISTIPSYLSQNLILSLNPTLTHPNDYTPPRQITPLANALDFNTLLLAIITVEVNYCRRLGQIQMLIMIGH